MSKAHCEAKTITPKMTVLTTPAHLMISGNSWDVQQNVVPIQTHMIEKSITLPDTLITTYQVVKYSAP